MIFNILPYIYPWQNAQWNQFVQQRQLQRLPHAWLLHGALGVGKQGFAGSVATALLCRTPTSSGAACGQCSSCQLIAAQTHPDLIVLQPQPAENSTSKTPTLAIRIEGIRQLCTQLTRTSQYEHGYRIALILDADKLVNAAANALLKTLEEPGSNTLIILTSSCPARLPLTIRSRCQQLRFPQPPVQQALAWLQTQGIEHATQWLELAHGAPLLALHCANQSAERQQFTLAMLAAAEHNSLQHADALAQLPRQQALGWLLDWLGDLLQLRMNSARRLKNEAYRRQLGAHAQHLDTRRLCELCEQTYRYLRMDATALRPELLWENLLISLEDL